MEKVKLTTVIIISTVIALVVVALLNTNLSLSEEKKNEITDFTDKLVSSLNSDFVPEYKDKEIDYEIQISLKEEKNQSTIKVKVDNVTVIYPVKMVDNQLKIGIDYKVVKGNYHSPTDNFMYALFTFCVMFTSIIIGIRIPFKFLESED